MQPTGAILLDLSAMLSTAEDDKHQFSLVFNKNVTSLLEKINDSLPIGSQLKLILSVFEPRVKKYQNGGLGYLKHGSLEDNLHDLPRILFKFSNHLKEHGIDRISFDMYVPPYIIRKDGSHDELISFLKKNELNPAPSPEQILGIAEEEALQKAFESLQIPYISTYHEGFIEPEDEVRLMQALEENHAQVHGFFDIDDTLLLRRLTFENIINLNPNPTTLNPKLTNLVRQVAAKYPKLTSSVLTARQNSSLRFNETMTELERYTLKSKTTHLKTECKNICKPIANTYQIIQQAKDISNLIMRELLQGQWDNDDNHFLTSIAKSLNGYAKYLERTKHILVEAVQNKFNQETETNLEIRKDSFVNTRICRKVAIIEDFFATCKREDGQHLVFFCDDNVIEINAALKLKINAPHCKFVTIRVYREGELNKYHEPILNQFLRVQREKNSSNTTPSPAQLIAKMSNFIGCPKAVSKDNSHPEYLYKDACL